MVTLKKIQDMGRALGLSDMNIRTRDTVVNMMFSLYSKQGMFNRNDLFVDRTLVNNNEQGTIVDFLKKEPHLKFVSADKGGGKTFLSKELILETRIRKGTQFNNFFPWIVPVPILIGETYSGENITSLDELTYSILKYHLNKDTDPLINKSPKYLERYGKVGQFLYVIDNIEKLDDEKQKQILDLVCTSFNEEEKHNHYIITGTEEYFEKIDIPHEADLLKILPYTKEQQEEHIDRLFNSYSIIFRNRKMVNEAKDFLFKTMAQNDLKEYMENPGSLTDFFKEEISKRYLKGGDIDYFCERLTEIKNER